MPEFATPRINNLQLVTATGADGTEHGGTREKRSEHNEAILRERDAKQGPERNNERRNNAGQNRKSGLPLFHPSSTADVILSLFRKQQLEASGDAFCKLGVLTRPRKYHVELRGSTLVMFRNAQVSRSEGILIRDIIAVLVLKHYTVSVSKRQGQSPRIYVHGPGLENGQTMYIKTSTESQLEVWRHALAIAESIDLPDLMQMTIESIIGQGGGGKVFLVHDKTQDSNFALKAIDKRHTFASSNALRHVISERNLMEIVGQHPFVLPMKFAFQTDFNLFLGTPFCGGGDLATYLKTQMTKNGAKSPETEYTNRMRGTSAEGNQPRRRYGGHLSEDRCRLLAAEVLLALEHLHDRGIVYRDLKPENVFIDDTGHIRLGDFGLAKHLLPSRMGNGFVRTSSICGTRNYLPPEMLFGRLYSFEVDLWSFGIMLFRILCGRFPFEANRTKDVFQKVKRERLTLPAHLSPEAKSLLEGLLTRDQSKRLSTRSAKSHVFFQSIEWQNVLRKHVEPPVPNVSPGESSIDALDNFEISKLQGITIGEYIPDEAEEYDLKLDPQGRMDVDGRVIGFEFAAVDEELPSPPPLEVKRTGSLLDTFRKITSLDSGTDDRRSVGLGGFSPRSKSPKSPGPPSRLFPDRRESDDGR